MEILQTDHFDAVNHGSRTTTLDTATVEAEWLRELLMDLPVVEKPVPAILMNCDNQTVIVKVNSAKDNTKSSRHVKRRLKSVRKMRNSEVISVTYIQTDKNLADPFTKGCHSGNPTYVIGDPVN